jgi:hypothetical protein
MDRKLCFKTYTIAHEEETFKNTLQYQQVAHTSLVSVLDLNLFHAERKLYQKLKLEGE